MLEGMAENIFTCPPWWWARTSTSGCVLYESPADVGADRPFVNAVAAYARWKRSLIVVRFRNSDHL